MAERGKEELGQEIPPPASDPIFIVGMNGSGTTLVLNSLGRQSTLYGFPGESQIIPRFILKLHRYGSLLDDANYLALWTDIRTSYPFRRYNNGAPVPLPSGWQSHPRTLAAVFDGVFGYFARAQGKSRWCEKTPMNALHIERLAATFPRSRFIHVIRDGRDCAVSLKRRMKYVPELTMYRWKRVVREARRQGTLIGDRYLELRYEEVTAEPEHWFQQVCAFIEVSFEEGIVSPPQDGTARRNPTYHIIKKGPIVHDGLRWPSELSPDEIASLDRIGGHLLIELGYEAGDDANDLDPSRYARAKMALLGYGGEAIRGAKRLMGNVQLPIRARVQSLVGRGWTQIRWWITNRRSAS